MVRMYAISSDELEMLLRTNWMYDTLERHYDLDDFEGWVKMIRDYDNLGPQYFDNKLKAYEEIPNDKGDD